MYFWIDTQALVVIVVALACVLLLPAVMRRTERMDGHEDHN